MVYTVTLNKGKLMKYYLNSLYGSLVYANTDSIKIKENEMKNYIIAHRDGKVGIIFKDKIESVFKDEDGNAIIRTIVGSFLIDDKYESIIKQII